MALPQSVLDLVEFTPIEDIVLAILRERIPDIPVGTLIAPHQDVPFVLVRRSPEFDRWRGDPRFLESVAVDIQVICSGIDSDDDAALLSEAVRVALRDAADEKVVYPGLGSLHHHTQTISAHRRPDWATATGPVQYADLPTEHTRYESTHRLVVRKPRS